MHPWPGICEVREEAKEQQVKVLRGAHLVFVCYTLYRMLHVILETYDHRLRIEFYTRCNHLQTALDRAHDKMKRKNPNKYIQAKGFDFKAEKV